MLSVTNSISNNVSHLFPVLHRELARALNSDLADFIGLRNADQEHTSSRAREGQVPR